MYDDQDDDQHYDKDGPGGFRTAPQRRRHCRQKKNFLKIPSMGLRPDFFILFLKLYYYHHHHPIAFSGIVQLGEGENERNTDGGFGSWGLSPLLLLLLFVQAATHGVLLLCVCIRDAYFLLLLLTRL